LLTSSDAILGRDGVTDYSGNFNSFTEDWQVLNTEQNLFQELHGSQHPAGCVYDASMMMEKKGEDFKRPFIRRRLMDRDVVTLKEAKMHMPILWTLKRGIYGLLMFWSWAILKSPKTHSTTKIHYLAFLWT
jgi:hypothetical protein